MTKQPNYDKKELCLRLLKSEMEEEVIAILKEYGYWSAHEGVYGCSRSHWATNGRGSPDEGITISTSPPSGVLI